MNQDPVNKYSIYCETEGTQINGYGTSAPNKCYNDTGHTVNLSSVKLLSLIGPSTVIAIDNSPGDGLFQVESVEILIPANNAIGIITKEFSFPFDMYLWQLSISRSLYNYNDSVSLSLGKDTTIGYLLNTTTIDTNIIHVSDTVFSNIRIGSDIGISTDESGSNVTEYPGRVINMDINNKTITTEKNLVNIYKGVISDVPQTIITLTLYPVKNITFCKSEGTLIIGSKGLKTKLVPANTVININYNYKSVKTEDVIVSFVLEYYY